MEVVSTWAGGYHCRVRARHFEVASDEPASVGGGDAGPTPTELLLMSVASCFTMALAHVARKRDVCLSELQVRVSGEYDGPRFRKVRIEVELDPAVDDVERLVRGALGVCYVSNTLRQPLALEVVLGDDVLVTHAPPPSPS